MNILEENRNILMELYEKYPESIKGLSMSGKNLVYNGNVCDISNFNINDLVYGDTNFLASLSVLNAEDVFRIIRLHALRINSTLTEEKKNNNEQKIEIIKEENPLMKNISIVTRSENGSLYEYFNIVDSNGNDYLFFNDRNVDIFAIYEELNARKGGQDVTPDELIEAVNRKLPQVNMESAKDLIDKSTTSEDFRNKMTQVNEPYKDEKTISVTGNEEHDIALVADSANKQDHRVVTFNQNEFGDLVVKENQQNVNGTDTKTITDGASASEMSSSSVTNESEYDVIKKEQEEVEAILIPTQEFYDLLNSPYPLTEEQRKSVDLYYGYFGDLILYEDYLLPELRSILNDFVGYVYELQYGDHEFAINEKQQEAIDKLNEMRLNHAAGPENLEQTKVKEAEKKLIKMISVDNYRDNAGSISTMQVVALIIGISIILTAITLYLIG